MLARCENPIQVMFSNTLENAMAGKKIIPLKEFYKNIADARESSFIKLDDLGMLTKASLLILICAIVCPKGDCPLWDILKKELNSQYYDGC